MAEAEQTGERIRIALERRGKKPIELARDLGRKPAIVSHWLTGRRTCPETTLREIAGLLKINYEWLAGIEPSPERAKREAKKMKDGRVSASTHIQTKLKWYFRAAPGDGGRDYGNANAFATPPDVPTLVRETGQNSGDAALRGGAGTGPVFMRFRLIELSRTSEAFRRFVEAAGIDDLRDHLRQASRETARLSEKLRDGLARLDGAEPLYLLRIDDYGTIGLPGDELSSDGDDAAQRSSPYAALTRNNLDTSKQSSSAGGSYGLGKAVLWNCSDLSTVLFASDIPDDARGTRIVGRSELTWHRIEANAYAGPGWLGVGEYGHSQWVGREDPVLKDLQLNRGDLPPGVSESRSTGTSALILGFRDPQVEGRIDSEDLLGKIARGAAENFWPALVVGRLRVAVEHVRDGTTINRKLVDPDEFVPEFCDAFRRHREDRVEEQLEEPGSVTRRPVILRVPATRDDAEGVEHYATELESRCHLLVRLEEDESQGADRNLANTVAMVRGRYMVTQYWNRDGIAMGASGFHAILLAGDAVGNEPPQLAAEQFLRLSEPPAHNDWKYEDILKSKFRLGAKQRLKEFRDGITTALRDAIKRPMVQEDEGPEELRRLLHLGKTGESPSPPAATLRAVRATFERGSWQIKADISFNDKKHRLRLTPRVWIDVESGSPIRLPWRTLEYQSGTAHSESDGTFEVGPNARAVSLSGSTEGGIDGIDPAKCRAKIDLVVDTLPVAEGS